jgi:hypothetical protein
MGGKDIPMIQNGFAGTLAEAGMLKEGEYRCSSCEAKICNNDKCVACKKPKDMPLVCPK